VRDLPTFKKKKKFIIFSAESCGNEGFKKVARAIQPILDIMKEPTVGSNLLFGKVMFWMVCFAKSEK